MSETKAEKRIFRVLSVDFGLLNTVLALVGGEDADAFDILDWFKAVLIEQDSINESTDSFHNVLTDANQRFLQVFSMRRNCHWRTPSRVAGYFIPDVDEVGLEMQPTINKNTLVLAHSAYTVCKMLFPEKTIIRFVHAGAKRRFWQQRGFELSREYKSQYARNKRESIEFCRLGLAHLPNWLEFLNEQDKLDDWTDAVNQAREMIEQLVLRHTAKQTGAVKIRRISDAAASKKAKARKRNKMSNSKGKGMTKGKNKSKKVGLRIPE
jgi:hypothetical protein